ncbi:MAG: S-methyl-5-thioribose-1-phosphate isomerase [Planctomycetota bacterium]
MPLPAIEWVGSLDGVLKIIDQTVLPEKLLFLELRNLEKVIKAIKILSVRGAPALGIAAAYGLYLGIRDSKATTYSFYKEIDEVSSLLLNSRPTAVNIKNTLLRIKNKIKTVAHRNPDELKKIILNEAHALLEEDKESCRKLGQNCQDLINDGDVILTVCNAGSLATGGIGTALAGIYTAKEMGKQVSIIACETRPLLQGARLTTWELMQEEIEVTLICDNMAGTVMKSGKIDSVFAGADRIAANGDIANKIGIYQLAVLANTHNIPFYIVAPLSTFDFSIETGTNIPIEERSADEITHISGRMIAPAGVRVFNPAFDVTPAELITAIICEKGVVKNISAKTLSELTTIN